MDGEGPESLNESLTGMVNEMLTPPTVQDGGTVRSTRRPGAGEPVEIRSMERQVLDRGLGKARAGRFLPPHCTGRPPEFPGLSTEGAPRP